MPIMQPPALKNLVGYTAFAAITLQEIADSASVPFLGSASTLTSSILNYVEVNQFSPCQLPVVDEPAVCSIKQGWVC
jgi:hypothetical protein